MPDIPPIVNSLVEQLSALPKVQKVILFGSRARGDNFPRSDIDLAVETSHADYREWSAIEEIIEETPSLLEFDLIRLDKAPDYLKEEILREGITLYARQ